MGGSSKVTHKGEVHSILPPGIQVMETLTVRKVKRINPCDEEAFCSGCTTGTDTTAGPLFMRLLLTAAYGRLHAYGRPLTRTDFVVLIILVPKTSLDSHIDIQRQTWHL